MPIPELLARAMIVDSKCKKMARTLGARAQDMALEAQKEAGQNRRIKEVLANSLNEQAGRLRYTPPMIDDALSEGEDA